MTLQPDICANRHGYNAHSFLANLRVAGRKHTLRERVYLSLADDGPQTCEQLSERLGMRYTTCSARIAELKAERWVVCSGAQRKTSGGTNAAVLRHLSHEERERLLHPGREYSGRQRELFGAHGARMNEVA